MSNHLKTKAQATDNAAPLILVLSLAAVIALGIAMLPFAAKAAGSDSGSSGSSGGSGYTVAVASKEMRKATVLINKEDFTGALTFLEAEIAKNPDNADAWNLTGFASRKMGDYAASEVAYDKALAIDPKHKGALEYKGELYLTLGNLEGAEDMFDRLTKACFLSCKEKKQLAAAIRTYKKAN
jgi:tetratricopeptide (TPR) repeat protein